MAIEINLRKGEIAKKGYLGFSWTTFFGGIIVPLVRGDWKWAIIMLVVGLITGGVSWFVFPFIYNKINTKDLIENQGFEPADDYSRSALVAAGILMSRA